MNNNIPVRFDCQPWEVKLILRLRQLRECQITDHILVDLANLQLFPVGNAEILEKQKVGSCIEKNSDV